MGVTQNGEKPPDKEKLSTGRRSDWTKRQTLNIIYHSLS